MKMLGYEEFINDFGKITRHRMNMSMYEGDFECACGKTHWFDHRVTVVGDGFYKVLVTCPEGEPYVTSLKIKTTFGFGFKGFVSLAGSKIETEYDKELFIATRTAAQLS